MNMKGLKYLSAFTVNFNKFLGRNRSTGNQTGNILIILGIMTVFVFLSLFPED